MRTFLQIIREFWIQILLSFKWAVYKVCVASDSDNLISVFPTNFSASIFLISWMFGQVIRVKKQHKIEDEFNIVKSELTSLLHKIETQTNNLIGYSTGGDSLAYFTPVIYDDNNISLELINNDTYPVFDFTGNWLNQDEENPDKGIKPHPRYPFHFQAIYPGKLLRRALNFDISGKESLRIIISAHTRSGRSVWQQFKILRVGDTIKIAH
ncbi:hypothetical protein [Flavobacterium agrisoli]|uniref:Uncharacterized protein n=1 Tax=Flavobacterium agrisoli TaxID=2793066 RepID=A0A934UIQ5_9FLAO|nr:hypothetical protein [Flavobacterium agrisoli]MBK0368625.1 hypothetical protein [Flavobacterium agrisoli]